MKFTWKTAFVLLGGAALGVATSQALFAQAKPPAYIVVAIRKVNDPETYKAVIDKASPAALAEAGGKYVVRAPNVIGLDGTPPQAFVMLAFDSVEKAKAWHDSPAAKEISAARIKSTDSLSFIVEGM
jgi:uncharacterized protein (DUF1330 family)